MEQKQYLTITECCEKLGLKPRVVYDAVKKHNLWFRKGYVDFDALLEIRKLPKIKQTGRPEAPIDWQLAKLLFKQGKSTDFVMNAFGITKSCLYMRCVKDNGINLKEFIRNALSQ
jgi:predicted DNA-binding transcriptional regulator AlpA